MSAALLLLLSAASVAAEGVTIAWDPVPDVSGYRVYIGSGGPGYVLTADVASATSATFSNLANGMWRFSVAAYSMSGTAIVTHGHSPEAVWLNMPPNPERIFIVPDAYSGARLEVFPEVPFLIETSLEPTGPWSRFIQSFEPGVKRVTFDLDVAASNRFFRVGP